MGSNYWQDRPVVLTGGTGLVGSWLLKTLLEAGASVTCLVRDWVPQSEAVRGGALEKASVVRGDICWRDTVERLIVESEAATVFHLAAQTIVPIANRNPVSTFDTNVRGTWNVLESCRRTTTVQQIIIASSDKAYGQQSTLPYTEATPLAGDHPYDVSKSVADLISLAYAKSYGLPIGITRCGNFFGGGDLNFNRLIPGTIRSILRGQRPIIRSNGKFIRDYFYVEDGAAAYMLLAEKLAEKPALRGSAFNFSNERPVSVLDVVQHILKQMKSKLEPEVLNEASNEIIDQHLSAERARKELAWSPKFDFDQGLTKTNDCYKEFLSTE